MALTRSKPASIFTPEGNSLAVFIDVADGTLKLKDVFGGVELFSDFISGGGGLNLKDDVLISATLTEVVDKDNTSSALLLATNKVKAESAEQCPLEVESTGTGGGIALLDNTTTNNTSVGIGALGNNLCFRSGGVAAGNARLLANGHFIIDPTQAFTDQPNFDFQVPQSDAWIHSVKIGRGGGDLLSNVRVGASALDANTTGENNVAIGATTLNNNTTGNNNTSVGNNALVANTSGSSNSAFGVGALQANTTGIYNVGIGLDSLLSNTDGGSNTALGMESLRNNTSGDENVSVGRDALYDVTTGSDNTAIGFNTGRGITTGSNNTILGANVTGLSSSLANNVIIADGSGNQRVVVDASGNVGLNNGTSTTQATSVIRSLGTNSGIALVPNGTGAITADVPDGTATGGNARGTNAVDFQTSRTTNTNVASGNFSTISGGQSNRASGPHASVIGGEGNSSNGFHSVTGGLNNTASSERSVAIGNQNNSSGFGAVISIGNNNTASGTNSVSIGSSNNTSAQSGLSFGANNTVSGVGSIAIGANNIITGNGFSLSRDSSITSPNGGTTLGNAALSYLQCQNTLASGTFPFGGSNGFAQQSLLTARKEQENFASGATTVLSLDGTGTTNLIIPNGTDRSWNVRVSSIARVTSITGTATGVSVGDSFMENKSILLKKVVNVSSIVGVGTAEIISDTSMSTAVMTYSVGASQELALTFTAPTFSGGGTLGMRIVSKIELVEVG
jgi:hypothetical protein